MQFLNLFVFTRKTLGFSILTFTAISFGSAPEVNQYFIDGWKKQIIPFALDIQNADAPKRSVKEETDLAKLGAKIFFDKSLSNPRGQSCASCHSPSTAFTDPQHASISPGAVFGRMGRRNAPTPMYSAYSPAFHSEMDEGSAEKAHHYVGGQFFDGRANSLEDQAKGPFLNPLEMNNTKEGVVRGVALSSYVLRYVKVFGLKSLSSAEIAYDNIAKAVAAFERTKALNSFTSKYDFYLMNDKKSGILSLQETRGLKVFNDKKKGNCAACHTSDLETGNDNDIDEKKVMFTDFTYDNLGVPANLRPNDQILKDLDLGLYETSKREEDKGRFKVPTLRNIVLTAPYMHNGYFKTLSGVIDFYATRDVKKKCPQLVSDTEALKRNCWPAAEYEPTVNHDELGNLNLSAQDKQDLEVFLGTLTDGYFVRTSEK